MSQSHPGSTNIAVSDADLLHLDRIVGAALAAGYRPGGRRPSRGTVVADLIRRATAALHQGGQGGPQQPPSGPQDAAPASAAPAQQDAPQSAAAALLDTLPAVPELPAFAAPAPAPRSYAPHYFAVHGEVR